MLAARCKLQRLYALCPGGNIIFSRIAFSVQRIQLILFYIWIFCLFRNLFNFCHKYFFSFILDARSSFGCSATEKTCCSSNG